MVGVEEDVFDDDVDCVDCGDTESLAVTDGEREGEREAETVEDE